MKNTADVLALASPLPGSAVPLPLTVDVGGAPGLRAGGGCPVIDGRSPGQVMPGKVHIPEQHKVLGGTGSWGQGWARRADCPHRRSVHPSRLSPLWSAPPAEDTGPEPGQQAPSVEPWQAVGVCPPPSFPLSFPSALAPRPQGALCWLSCSSHRGPGAWARPPPRLVWAQRWELAATWVPGRTAQSPKSPSQLPPAAEAKPAMVGGCQAGSATEPQGSCLAWERVPCFSLLPPSGRQGQLLAGDRCMGVLPTEGDRQDLGAQGEAVSPYSSVLSSPSHSQWQPEWDLHGHGQVSAQLPRCYLG